MISAGGVAGAGYYAGGGSDEGRGQQTPNYYTGASAKGEPAGEWHGRLAEHYGLTGAVAGPAMEAVFDRLETPDGQPIGKRSVDPARVDRLDSLQGQIDRLEQVRGQLADGSIDSTAPVKFESIEDGFASIPERIDALRLEVGKGSTSGWSRGLDLTFSPPKSVTVAHTAAWRAELEAERAGNAERASSFAGVREAIEDAIFEANESAMEYATQLATTRIGSTDKGSVTWIPAGDLVRASFFQHTSRAEDPQLHIHNPILNRCMADDGKIRSIDTKDLLQQRGAISAVADRVLFERLADAGLASAVRPDGLSRELVIVDPATSELFSQRRAAITQAMGPAVAAAEERLGRELNNFERDRLARTQTLVTREAKSKDDLDTDALLDKWQDRMVDELGRGLNPLAERIALAIDGGQAGRVAEFSAAAVGAEAVQAVAERKAVWTRADLMREIDLRLPLVGLPTEQLHELLHEVTDRTLQGHGVQQIGGKVGIEPPADLVRGSYTRPSSVTYAAPVTLQAEDIIRQTAIQRGGFSLNADAVNDWLDEQYGTRIGADQRAAVVGIASTDAALVQLLAPAGTGKSYTSGALAGAWEALSDGGRVHGLTTSTNAAEILRGDGIAASANTAIWRGAQERLEAGRPIPEDLQHAVGPRDLILIDEASMIDRADVDYALAVAQSIGARTALVGDPYQLTSVNAGGVLGLVHDRAETYPLTDVRRFDEQWERQASLALREGQPDAFLEYDRHGRLVEADTLDDAIAKGARAAAADILAGKGVVVTADTNEIANRIANEIREYLVGAGAAEEVGIELNRTGSIAGIGDSVMTRHNDYEAGVHNRDVWTVTGVGDDGSLSVTGTDGQVKELSAEYVDQNVQLAYASTVHASQGGTWDRSHWVTDGSGAAYVPLTRGQERNTAYVALQPQQQERAPWVLEDEARPSARAILENGLGRDDPARAARVEEQLEDAQLASMHTISDRIEQGVQAAVRMRLENDLDRLAEQGVLSVDDRARLASDQSTEHLSRVVRAAEQAGHDPATVLRGAIEQRSLGDARNVAQVLASRISTALDVTAAVPGQVTPERLPESHTQYIAQWQERADARQAELGTKTALDAPQWATRGLGAVPLDATERLEWEAKAGRIAGYREAVSFTDAERAIPSAPGLSQTEQRAHWWGAWEALGRPTETRAEAAMTDGQLRVRVGAWEREQQWAPPHADNSLRTAEQQSAQARQESILAAARGEAEEAEQLAAESDRQASIARSMTDVVEARGTWATNTAVTRDFAQRAASELEERGLEPAHERDRVSAEEWKQEHDRAVELEDAHREITELDLDPAADAGYGKVPTPDENEHVWRNEPPVERTEDGTSRAHQRAPIEPADVELEAIVSSAREAQDEAADRASQEAVHEDSEAEHEAAPEATGDVAELASVAAPDSD